MVFEYTYGYEIVMDGEAIKVNREFVVGEDVALVDFVKSMEWREFRGKMFSVTAKVDNVDARTTQCLEFRRLFNNGFIKPYKYNYYYSLAEWYSVNYVILALEGDFKKLEMSVYDYHKNLPKEHTFKII